MGDFQSEVSRRLRENAIEITQSLDMFMNERNECLQRQSNAMDEYNAAIEAIGKDVVDIAPEEVQTDHNLNRHLKITKKAALDDDYPEFERQRLTDESQYGSRFDTDYVDVPQKEYFDKGLTPKPPMPNLLEKAAMREKVFVQLRSAREQETQLELEYERVREEVGAFRAEYLAEGIFTTQKENYIKIKALVADYQPQGFGKAWGADPDYVQMSLELKNSLSALDKEEENANADMKKKTGKKTKKSKGH
jgi:hypothetical protein